jgi:hypothetical protein
MTVMLKQSLRGVPPLFLVGVMLNWTAMGVLAWEPRWVIAVVVLLAAGTGVMFLGAYTHRPAKR